MVLGMFTLVRFGNKFDVEIQQAVAKVAAVAVAAAIAVDVTQMRYVFQFERTTNNPIRVCTEHNELEYIRACPCIPSY